MEWSYLLPDIISNKLGPLVLSSGCSSQARLVCRHWAHHFRLPCALIVSGAASRHHIHQLYAANPPKYLFQAIPNPTFPSRLFAAVESVRIAIQDQECAAADGQLFKDLQGSSALRKADFSGSCLPANFLDFVAGATRLRTLILTSSSFANTQLEGDFTQRLATLSSLRSLVLNQTLISFPEDLKLALLSCSSLTSVSLAGIRSSTPTLFEFVTSVLIETTRIRYLNLSDNRLWDADTAAALGSALGVNQTLTSLDMTKCFDNGTERYIFKALETNSTLSKLLIARNALSDCESLVHSLRKNSSLSYLSLRAGAQYTLAPISTVELLEAGAHLRTLNLAGLRLNGAQQQRLVSILRTHQHLTSLNLSNTRLDPEIFADFHLTNAALTQLNLAGNFVYGPPFIREAEVQAAFQSTAKLRNLTDLNLRSVRFQRETLAVVAKALAASQSLRVLNLANGLIGIHEPGPLEPLFRESKSLTHLDLSRNVLAAPGAQALLQWLPGNRNLSVLFLKWNYFDSAICTELEKVRVESTAIITLEADGDP